MDKLPFLPIKIKPATPRVNIGSVLTDCTYNAGPGGGVVRTEGGAVGQVVRSLALGVIQYSLVCVLDLGFLVIDL